MTFWTRRLNPGKHLHPYPLNTRQRFEIDYVNFSEFQEEPTYENIEEITDDNEYWLANQYVYLTRAGSNFDFNTSRNVREIFSGLFLFISRIFGAMFEKLLENTFF